MELGPQRPPAPSAGPSNAPEPGPATSASGLSDEDMRLLYHIISMPGDEIDYNSLAALLDLEVSVVRKRVRRLLPKTQGSIPADIKAEENADEADKGKAADKGKEAEVTAEAEDNEDSDPSYIVVAAEHLYSVTTAEGVTVSYWGI
ncbi:hypothetical protein N7452_001599 [Penicillium brevicompactum]|uniref:Uncharacterized protein n=1 Tax=Penicillium brevicompactum TaxID=5074 RepID=A0A9W9R2V4_PENBR|nr:hypothetical protein N7452_001599 [Penicillium brevicompactum]